MEANILAIDDESLNLEIISNCLDSSGYSLYTAKSGLQGFEVLADHPEIDLILLDRIMPGMNGIDFIRKLKKNDKLKEIPVIMQTAAASDEKIIEGVNEGVFFYLVKPYKRSILMSVVNSAVKFHNRNKDLIEKAHNSNVLPSLVREGCFQLQTVEEAENLAYFLANSYPIPDKAVIGIYELLLNAIEHGNLGIGEREKFKLIKQNALKKEIIRRMQNNANKFVEVNYIKDNYQIQLSIKDHGNGFDYNSYMISTMNVKKENGGRGIVNANLYCFDKMEYSEGGRCVTTVVFY